MIKYFASIADSYRRNDNRSTCESGKSCAIREEKSNDFGSGRGHLLRSIPTLPLPSTSLTASILFQWDGTGHAHARNSTNHMDAKKGQVPSVLSSSQYLATYWNASTVKTNRLRVEFLRTHLGINSFSQWDHDKLIPVENHVDIEITVFDALNISFFSSFATCYWH